LNDKDFLSRRIAFVGAGNMANSLIGGLIAKGIPAKNISASDPYEATLKNIAAQYAIPVSPDNHEVISGADVIVLAVKPQVMKPVAEQLAPALEGKKVLVISIAAGISLQSLQRWLGEQIAIVRCMPNTPALVQLGATGLFANHNVTGAQKNLAKNILDAVGISLWLNSEKELDAVTALSGSGPAYYFLLMEAMIKAGMAQGLAPETAKQLTLQTALGAATMAARSNDEPAELRRKVTSPNGTTEQAILSFQKNRFEEIVREALDAAARRSASLSEESGRD
jgi:pyrroline-5-carboxylate reductase